ncbi:unnamed protein product [Coregonus sp. 'balchen']|nr:unnamed protein product [Coregonus sp. 'balchen']
MAGRERDDCFTMAEESAVKVCVRVRPLIERSFIWWISVMLLIVVGKKLLQKTPTDKQTIHQVDDGNLTKNFSFGEFSKRLGLMLAEHAGNNVNHLFVRFVSLTDRIFSAEEATLQLYQELAKPLVVSTVEGYNGTIFAYGQTASGKTITMMGSSLTPGVIPLPMEDVFQTIKHCPKKEFLLRVSYLDIYNETLTYLLCDSWKRKPLEI